jgi:cytochrome c553
MMRIRIGPRGLILLVLALAVGGFLFAWSGLFNVGASTGHWRITSWFLHFAMRNSVETHAMGIDAPALDDPALVHRGAGHFATGCAPCHGAPGEPRSPIVREMTPHPPSLGPSMPSWKDRELFWIVKHGVKYTGMPAWPARERDDEVWSMVAFLRSLPELDSAGYQRLALGELANPGDAQGAGTAGLNRLGDALDANLADCARCHGRDGLGRGVAAFPNLAGQNEVYLALSLEAYSEGLRNSGIMQPAAAKLDEEEIRALAAHYASQPFAPTEDGTPPDRAAIERGRDIARTGVASEGVPACASCHGPDGRARYPAYPSLAGQPVEYLATQLRLFKQHKRGGTPFAHIMETIAERLNEDQIVAAASYFASLEEPRDQAAGDPLQP